MSMKTKVSWKNGADYQAELSNGSHIISGDKGKKEAMNPPEMLLASLGTCSGLFLRPELKKIGLECNNLEIILEGKKAEPPQLFSEITLYYHLESEIKKTELETAIEESHKKCFIRQSLHPEIEINSVIKLKGEA